MARNDAAGPLRIALVEDQREIREGLRFLIDSTAGYSCTGCYAAMEDALEAVGPGSADLVLADIGLPGMSGIEGIRRLRERHGPHRLRRRRGDLPGSLRRATGYLLKKTPPARLLEALRDAVAGGSPMSPEVATRVIALFREFRPADQAEHNLTRMRCAS